MEQPVYIDLLATNSTSAVVFGVESTLSVGDIKEFMERLPLLKQFFKIYTKHQIYGAVAGIAIDKGADRFAYKNGLFVIGQKGDLAQILNDKKFKPKVW